jgi:tape measure domain-containing protein
MSQEIAALQVVIEAQTSAFTKGIQEAQKSLEKLNATASSNAGGINNIAKQFEGLRGTFFAFNQATAAVSTGLALINTAASKLGGFVKAADESRKFTKVLEELTGSLPRAKDLMNSLFDVAENGDMSMKQAQRAIIEMVKATKDLAVSNEDIKGVTTTFFQLGKIGGKSAEEMAGAWRQFTIALQRGELGLGQINRMMRTSPELAAALAKAFDTSAQGLERMAKNGELTADKIVAAFRKMGPEVADKFEKLPKTFQDGMEQLGRIMEKFSKELSKLIFDSEAVGVAFENFNKVVKSALTNVLEFVKDLKENVDVLKAVVLGLAIAFAGPLLLT